MDYDARIQATVDYIEENICKPIDLSDLSKKAFCSVPHFYRIFSSVVGMSVMDYIRKRRLSIAAHELVNTSKRIIDIAFDYEFKSQEVFTRAFLKEFGITPGAYRKNRGEGITLYEKFNVSECMKKMAAGKLDVRIVKFEPVKVAYYKGYGVNPERKAWIPITEWLLADAKELYFRQFGTYPSTKELLKYAEENDLYKPPKNRRYFGFDNPLKTEGKPEYGYEVWVIVNDGEKEDDKVKIKDFEGGLYAVTRAKKSTKSLIETWQKLFKWLETSGYKHGSHQWLEEYITIEGQKGFVAFDLYMPISE
ncbi:MAG TPA: AraC family transcriptional regulator [Clostridiales bacterium]|nr:AraC family transcriptional regulator [Clostridiales bacterium]